MLKATCHRLYVVCCCYLYCLREIEDGANLAITLWIIFDTPLSPLLWSRLPQKVMDPTEKKAPPPLAPLSQYTISARMRSAEFSPVTVCHRDSISSRTGIKLGWCCLETARIIVPAGVPSAGHHPPSPPSHEPRVLYSQLHEPFQSPMLVHVQHHPSPSLPFPLSRILVYISFRISSVLMGFISSGTDSWSKMDVKGERESLSVSLSLYRYDHMRV